MWGDKKQDTPQPTTAKAPETPAPVAQPASAKTEGISMSTDAMRPLSTTPSGPTPPCSIIPAASAIPSPGSRPVCPTTASC